MNNGQPLLGFAPLSQRQPVQLMRLARRLSEVFDDPPITIHHEFSQCGLEPNDFLPNVQFVILSIITKWGDWSVTKAAMAAFKNLYMRPGYPQWVILLSGNDYPIQKPGKIKAFYKNTSYDAFVSSKKLTCANLTIKQEFYWYARYNLPKNSYPSLFHILKKHQKKIHKRTDSIKRKMGFEILNAF